MPRAPKRATALATAAVLAAGLATTAAVVSSGADDDGPIAPGPAHMSAVTRGPLPKPVEFTVTSTLVPEPGIEGLPPFRQAGHRLRAVAAADLPYALGEPREFFCKGPVDASGVRLSERQGVLREHPVVQAQCGLELVEGYRVSQDRAYLDRALRHAQRLVDTRVDSRDAWWFPYPFDFRLYGRADQVLPAPWYSGMAQGQALSLFVRLHQLTGDQKWRTAADQTFASFLRPPSGTDPWVTFTREGWLWLAEYADWPLERSQRVLNGHMFAMFGLYDYARLTGNQQAVTLFDGSATALAAHVPAGYRQREWISWYTLDQRITSAKYHGIHIGQLLDIAEMTGQRTFAAAADQLTADYPPPALKGQVRLAAGAHPALTLDATGKVTAQTSVSLPAPTTLISDQRARVRGRGIHYHLTKTPTNGPLADRWIPEQPGVRYLLGRHLDTTYAPARDLTLTPGPHTGAQIRDTGSATNTVATRRSVTLQRKTTIPITRTALIDGRLSALIPRGPLTGLWIPLGEGATLT